MLYQLSYARVPASLAPSRRGYAGAGAPSYTSMKRR